MPKGIYNRNKVQEIIQQEPVTNPISHEVGINKVRVSQMPDRQSANANVEVIRQSHGDESISTTERLFGSLEEQQKANNEDPRVSQEPLISVPVAQTPDEAEQPKFKQSNSPEPESTPIEDDFIDWEKMQNKKIRQKIDGKEVVITADELKKYSDQDQIKKHLAEAADKVGQERRKLAEERQQWNEQRNRVPQGTPTEVRVPQEQNVNYQNLQNDPVFQRLQFLEQQVQQLAQGTQPVIYETNRQRVSNELKAQGFNDFMDYLPKMETMVMGIKDPNLVQFYDTPEGSKALYFQLKAQDLQRNPAKVVQEQIIPRGTSNPTPPSVQIDGGGQSSGQYIDDSNHNYRAAFKKARTLGDDREAWNDVLRNKIPHIMGE